MDEELIVKLMPVIKALRLYHRHEVFGVNHIPKKGGVIVVTNHSLATYDISLLMAAVYDTTGRFPRSLIDHSFYKFPLLGDVMEKLGCVAGTPENGEALLRNGEIIYIAPGGMRESLRPSTEKYKIIWNRRRGFVRLAIRAQVPIVLAACPAADDLYRIYENPLTKVIYQKFRLPFFLARGIGLSPLPRNVKLQHFLSEPLYPPKMLDDPKSFKRQVNRFHQKVVSRMQSLMDHAAQTLSSDLIPKDSSGNFHS